MFDEKTKEYLKYYVYLLIDPVSEEPFYVGKGKDNRVFAHINQELENEQDNLKYQEIQRIGPQQVKHVIVRHGLTESTAFAIEASLIDTFRHIPSFNRFTRGNIQAGYNSIEKGLMTSNEIIALYNAQEIESIGTDCLIININKNYEQGAGTQAIYDATKEIWKMAAWRTDNYTYVLSEFRGLIRAVFKVDRWYTKSRQDKNGEWYEGYGFDGTVAESSVSALYINKSISRTKPHGYGSPIIFPETLMKWIKKKKGE